MTELPTGTVTFLFTDLEVSTRLWEQEPEAMRAALARHDLLLREAVAAYDGHIVKGTGDGIHAVFATADGAVGAAVDAQLALAAEQWSVSEALRVRIGMHTGVAELREGDYFGSAVNRAARLMAIAHGGQVVCSQATADLVRDVLSEDVELVDLGEHRLRDLSRPERVVQVSARGVVEEFPLLRSLDVTRTNLPVQLTSFVGRDDEVKQVCALLVEHRMVTLTGVGGVGKTRLALQVAAELLDEFPDGVWLVELAPVGEDARVVETIAAALGVEPAPGKTIEQSLLDAIRSQAMLMVLDNCEHLLDETNRLVGVMVRGASGLAVLATSREPLGVAGEHTVALRSLDAPTAVRLFTDRATAFDASFVLLDSDVDAVEHLCRRLDGVPLAIELAAARVRMFSPTELAARLDERFRWLTGGRGAVERHQTLRAAIDWSYELLSDRDCAVFDRLSVFAGGCTLDAAQVVCAGDGVEEMDVADALASLIDKSLVDTEHTDIGTRYRQLETIRQYGEEHLLGSGEADAVRERHARFFGGFARQAGRQLWSADELEWARRVEADLGNVRAAVSWAVAAGATDLAMRIAGALVNQAVERPIWATASIAEHALGAPGADQHPWRANLMGEAAMAALRRGDLPRARQLVDDALDAQRAGARFSAPVWTYALMILPASDLNLDVAHQLAVEGLQRAEAASDPVGTIALRATYALNLAIREQARDARTEAERTLTDARTLGQPALIAMGLLALGYALVVVGEPERGLVLLRESVELAETINSSWQLLNGLSALAATEAIYGNAAEAAALLRSQLLTARESGETHFALGAAYGGLAVFNRYDRPELTARVDGALSSLLTLWPGNWEHWHAQAVRDARAALGDDRYNTLASEGSTITEQALFDEILEHLEAFIEQHPRPH
jgi:predicted ATPase/class 3 adenylate cyclase